MATTFMAKRWAIVLSALAIGAGAAAITLPTSGATRPVPSAVAAWKNNRLVEIAFREVVSAPTPGIAIAPEAPRELAGTAGQTEAASVAAWADAFRLTSAAVPMPPQAARDLAEQ
ncbi:hypothetical protein [Acuticoccus mangrovi]|uniref:Uncharacterized protein n=1 Tax=Acuticoccus mangrovi TaxID=2796142 RepID=A0A934ISM9_9HYPH|nr:hypothetical protein [Acuticoccus mangrovi]MBJ3776934.1 hypothetical protein [Acuticoccus mangrovi]